MKIYDLDEESVKPVHCQDKIYLNFSYSIDDVSLGELPPEYQTVNVLYTGAENMTYIELQENMLTFAIDYVRNLEQENLGN